MDTPGNRYKALKQVVLEWVVTNGSLPGFEERVQSSKPLWKVVGSEGMKVYRGQGHSIPGIPNHGDPATLLNGVRPILATTKTPEIAKRYMGKECCFFEIQLQPGIRYVDAKDVFTFQDKATGESVTNVSNEIIDNLLRLTDSMGDGYWVKKAHREGNGRNAVRNMFLKRINEEEEILIDSTQGGLTITPHTFKVKYTPRGRGRTFRTKALRRNKKNGRRLTHKSQNGRNRRPGYGRHSNA
jgi:hypothetical protein